LIEGEGYIDVVLDKTPFYAECGGQIGDSGFLTNETLKAEVLTTFKVNHLFVHRCQVVNGEINVGDSVHAAIDLAKREEIRVHHTSAHLLQAALIKVVGDEVKQAGSLVEENRMRFDFTFSRAMTPQEIQKTEDILNKWIAEKLEVHTDVMDIEQAKLTGATALFGEKYEDVVRVVNIGYDKNCISKEFCAGTHARNTGDLRLAKIVSESAIAAGTRRIEVVVSDAALKYLNEKEQVVNSLAARFKAHTSEILDRVEKLAEENRELQKELTKVKEEAARGKFASLISLAKDIDGGKLFISKVDDSLDGNAMKTGVELLSNKLGESIVVIANSKSVIAKVSDNFIAKGVNAGKIVGDISRATGANGGGRPNFAQGGIKDSSALDSVLSDIEAKLK